MARTGYKVAAEDVYLPQTVIDRYGRNMAAMLRRVPISAVIDGVPSASDYRSGDIVTDRTTGRMYHIIDSAVEEFLAALQETTGVPDPSNYRSGQLVTDTSTGALYRIDGASAVPLMPGAVNVGEYYMIYEGQSWDSLGVAQFPVETYLVTEGDPW